MSTGPPRGLRVLAWPSGEPARENPHIAGLYAGLRARGWTIEPFTRRRLVTGRHDIFHMHWPEYAVARGSAVVAAWRALVLLAAMWVARRRGTRVVWMVHNLHPHEARHPRLLRAYRTVVNRLVDATVNLSRAGADDVRATYPVLARRPAFVVPHAEYTGAYPPAPDRDEERARLGVPPGAPLLLFFGQIRGYKGTHELLDAFAGWERPDARLVVAGRPAGAALRAELEALARDDGRIDLRLGFVEEDEVPALFGPCDLVVLPYRRILNSGAALLALSFARPVLVPASAQFAELGHGVGPGWVLEYDGPLTAAALAAGAKAAAAVREARPDLSAHAWPRVVEQTAEALAAAAQARRPVPAP